MYLPFTRYINMPMPVRVGMAVAGGGGLSYFAYWMFGSRGLLVLFLGMIVVGLIVSLYAWIVKKVKKRKAARFGRDMKAQGSMTPQTITQAEQIAKIDDIRRRFEEGVTKFSQAGKDVYSLPWYVVVGEPGSGKTEAVRHSNIGFPPGLQDELQGVGGTINMNWWFTNHAVLLDLAGRVMFESVAPGQTNEWLEFLKLLRANRPNCPINGMLLVIPADSLIKDSPEEIQRKGQTISRQLDLITRTLDIRFPVFVVVTKCDLVNGFREFFDDVNVPQLQHQIFGWSNPTSIDDPFNPEQVNAYLATVRDRIERRRLALLQDPTPAQDLSERRIDEVDTLYDFPDSFARLVPAIKSYLQLIFVSSEWSVKPLFLRGIFFTSSMREGAALDAGLAEALGVPMDSLPEGRVWERDRAYFLRDVFMNKVFPEWGLVTRATNVRKQHLRRRLAIMGSGLAGVLLLILLTWLGGRSLARSIGTERDIWESTAEALSGSGGEAGRGLPIVARQRGQAPVYRYLGSEVVKAGVKKLPMSGFHEHLQEKVKAPLPIPWIFRITRPFDDSLNRQRIDAHRISFELSVLDPLVRATREKLMDEADGAWSPAATAALGELVRLEAQADALEYPPEVALDERLSLNALFKYVLPREDYEVYADKDRDEFDDILAWCFSPEGGGASWPPAWLRKGGHLDRNESVDKGVDRFIAYCCSPEELVALNGQIKRISELWPLLSEFSRTELPKYQEAESRFLRVFGNDLDELRQLQGFVAIEKDWHDKYALLKVEMGALDERFASIEASFGAIPICGEANIAAAYMRTASNALAAVDRLFSTLPLPAARGGLKGAVADAVEGAAGIEVAPDIGDEIRARMKAAVDELVERYLRSDSTRDLTDLGVLYGRVKARVTAYRKRFPVFEPIRIPEDLRIPKLEWVRYHAIYGQRDVAEIQGQLEGLCKKINAVFTGYREVVTNAPLEKVDVIRELSAQGIERVESRNFKRECESTLDNWSRLEGDAIKDREILLGKTGKDFVRDYMNTGENSSDYVVQYWDDLVYGGLHSLVNDALAKTAELLPKLEPYARFPLDRPEPGEVDLSAGEVIAAAELLGRIQPRPTVEGGKTLGEGASTEVARMDAEFARLRSLDLGPIGEWIASAKRLLAAIPTKPDRRLACKVLLPPIEEQARLLGAFGKGSMKDDSALPVWTVIEVAGTSGDRPIKHKTHQAKLESVGRVLYPGDPFKVLLYRYHGDAAPDRTISYEGAWAALRALHVLPCEQSKDSPTKWNIQVTEKDDTGHARTLWLTLDYEQPLPSLANWPTFRK